MTNIMRTFASVLIIVIFSNTINKIIMETELFWGFNLQAWITIVTVLGMFTTLLLTKLRADVVFMAAIGVLFVTGVIDAKEACSGFSSSSVVVIGVLKLTMMPSRLVTLTS